MRWSWIVVAAALTVGLVVGYHLARGDKSGGSRSPTTAPNAVAGTSTTRPVPGQPHTSAAPNTPVEQEATERARLEESQQQASEAKRSAPKGWPTQSWASTQLNPAPATPPPSQN